MEQFSSFCADILQVISMTKVLTEEQEIHHLKFSCSNLEILLVHNPIININDLITEHQMFNTNYLPSAQELVFLLWDSGKLFLE